MRTEKIFKTVEMLLKNAEKKHSLFKNALIKIRPDRRKISLLKDAIHKKMDPIYGSTAVEESFLRMDKNIENYDQKEMENLAQSIKNRNIRTSNINMNLTDTEKRLGFFQFGVDKCKEALMDKLRRYDSAKSPDELYDLTVGIEELSCKARIYERRIRMEKTEGMALLNMIKGKDSKSKTLQDKIFAIEEFLRIIKSMCIQFNNPIVIENQGKLIQYPKFININLLAFFKNQISEVLLKVGEQETQKIIDLKNEISKLLLLEEKSDYLSESIGLVY